MRINQNLKKIDYKFFDGFDGLDVEEQIFISELRGFSDYFQLFEDFTYFHRFKSRIFILFTV